MALTGRIYDIQGFSVQDGPGIRTTVFLKGCPLRCPWCHSPESQEFPTELNWMQLRCPGLHACGKCLSACPRGCITRGPLAWDPAGQPIAYPLVDKTGCDGCGLCAGVCKAQALYLCGEDMTVDQVMHRLERDKPFFDESGGGMTVSGGECLSQPDFTAALLGRCRTAGIHTAVDTTGFVPWPVLARVLPDTDLFLYDLKCMDSALHEQVIGVPNALILDNARKLAEAGAKLQVRIPVIPQFNESEAHFRRYGTFLRELGQAVTLVQLLPYHSMGVSKYQRLLRHEKVFVAQPPADSLMNARRDQLAALGLNVIIH